MNIFEQDKNFSQLKTLTKKPDNSLKPQTLNKPL